ncbi:MAG TPA: EamA family transporter [Ramlibacter sp.]|nr:EamA family transporter [Ramlibacter sp.]
MSLPTTATGSRRLVDAVPPHAFFAVSAVFHYLGPSFAVLLFASIAPLGVAWLRIAIAALLLAAWAKPWRMLGRLAAAERRLVLALGVVLAAMNCVFYLAIAQLPLATVGAIEFIGPIVLAVLGTRSSRNAIALVLTVAGLLCLVQLRIPQEPAAFGFALANAALFALYVVIGHRLASTGQRTSPGERLACAMAVAAVAGLPFGLIDALPALRDPWLLAAAAGVAVSSSVVPYLCDQVAMRRLPRASFSLFLAILPAVAVLIGYFVLGQRLTAFEGIGVLLVVAGVALHRPAFAPADEHHHDRRGGQHDD